MNSNYKKEMDSLALGLTCSPMFMGVTVRMFFANLLICTLICIDANTLLGIPLFIFTHFLMVRLSVKEPDFFYIYAKAFFKTPPVMNYWYWGMVNSYEPW